MLANTIAIHFENVENGWDWWFVENLFYFFFRSSFPDLAVNVGFHYLGGEAFGTLLPGLFL